jgi:hypothetical protein
MYFSLSLNLRFFKKSVLIENKKFWQVYAVVIFKFRQYES